MKKNVNSNPALAESTYKVVKKLRGDWGEISPVTKVIPNKKKNRKPKHKSHDYED